MGGPFPGREAGEMEQPDVAAFMVGAAEMLGTSPDLLANLQSHFDRELPAEFAATEQPAAEPEKPATEQPVQAQPQPSASPPPAAAPARAIARSRIASAGDGETRGEYARTARVARVEGVLATGWIGAVPRPLARDGNGARNRGPADAGRRRRCTSTDAARTGRRACAVSLYARSDARFDDAVPGNGRNAFAGGGAMSTTGRNFIEADNGRALSAAEIKRSVCSLILETIYHHRRLGDVIRATGKHFESAALVHFSNSRFAAS
jgi:hypothetical protein